MPTWQYRREQRVTFEAADYAAASVIMNQLDLSSPDDESDDPGELEELDDDLVPMPDSEPDTEDLHLVEAYPPLTAEECMGAAQVGNEDLEPVAVDWPGHAGTPVEPTPVCEFCQGDPTGPDRCGLVVSGFGPDVVCTRPAGHPGQHVMCNSHHHPLVTYAPGFAIIFYLTPPESP